MEATKIIHLEKPNTLATFLSEKERQEIVSLKISGYIGREDFDEVLDDMCELWGVYDEDDNYTPDYEGSAASGIWILAMQYMWMVMNYHILVIILN